MVLSGDGGDEAFAGYHSYLAWMGHGEGKQEADLRPLWKRALHPVASALFPVRYPPRSRRKPGATLENWLSFINFMPTRLRKRLWRKDYKDVAGLTLDLFEREYERAREYSIAHKVQYMDLKTYLPFDILTKVDVQA
jgi:asparagine synthase (glutamine-hydrolysing)